MDAKTTMLLLYFQLEYLNNYDLPNLINDLVRDIIIEFVVFELLNNLRISKSFHISQFVNLSKRNKE